LDVNEDIYVALETWERIQSISECKSRTPWSQGSINHDFRQNVQEQTMSQFLQI
jgi:hypothetical protein